MSDIGLMKCFTYWGDSFHERKRQRTEHYFKWVHKNKLETCTACNGSGYYDHNGSPDCGCCDGTGKTRERE